MTLLDGTPTVTWVARPWTASEATMRAHAAGLAKLRTDIITKAIAMFEADATGAAARATAIGNAIGTVQTRKGQVQSFNFNGSTVAAINTQLNTALKPLLVDILTYIVALGNITQGLETWRGDNVDKALIWLARHGTDTTD